jgi:hypothetical protein
LQGRRTEPAQPIPIEVAGEAPEVVAAPAEPALLEPAVAEAPPDSAEALEKTFEAIAQELVVEAVEDEEEDKDETDIASAHRKKKKGKKPVRLVEYDPLSGQMVVTRRHKRGDDPWEGSGP